MELLTVFVKKYWVKISKTSVYEIKSSLTGMLQGIKCYNPDNILILVNNVSVQAREVGYDLETNLTLLKLNQFNNELHNITYVEQILLKAVTNLRHSDCIICKSLLSQEVLNDLDLSQVEENTKIKKSRRK